jgi:hypothetical protein
LIKQASFGRVTADNDYHWIPIAQRQPFIGTKVQLINKDRGVAVYGQWFPKSEWTHWAPLPTFKKDQS